MPGFIIAQRLGINGFLVARITGTVYVSRGSKAHPSNANKINVGLNLKSKRKNEEVAGYTKKIEDQWYYSTKALQTVAEYIKEYVATVQIWIDILFSKKRKLVIYAV